MGAFDLTKIDVTVTCTANRRLSLEGRKLSTYTGKVGNTITVPAGHSVSATKVASSLNAVTAAQWKSSVQTYATAEGKTITPTSVTATTAGVTDVKCEFCQEHQPFSWFDDDFPCPAVNSAFVEFSFLPRMQTENNIPCHPVSCTSDRVEHFCGRLLPQTQKRCSWPKMLG